MLGFINAPAVRQKKNGFNFSVIDRSHPTADKIITPATAQSSVGLTDLPTLDAVNNGISIALRFSNANWNYAGTEMIFAIGDSNNYIYFQKRQSGYKFRWGMVANGNVVLVDEVSVDYLYNGNFTVGASITNNEMRFCLNGVTISKQATGIVLPAITDASTIEIGQFFGGSQGTHTGIVFDSVQIWNQALSRTEVENATFEAQPLDAITFDNSLWTVVKAGQSNSKANVNCVAPGGYTPNNPSRMKMIGKDMTVRPYTDPYTTLDNGNLLTAFDDVGGFSGAGVTIDNLATQYSGQKFAAMPINRGGLGLVFDNGSDKWSDYDYAVISNGDNRHISLHALVGYLSMLIARQYGHVLAIEWYQGEADALDASTVTAVEYNTALADLFDKWRLVLPPIRIVVGLSDEPANLFANWAEIQSAQASFTYPDTYLISAQGLSVLGSEDYHLDGQGQYDLGVLTADKIIAVHQ